MVADPCGAELVPGIYGSTQGMLGRFKTSIHPGTPAAGLPQTCGFILWCPDFHLDGSSSPGGNLFIWRSSGSDLRPLNDAVFPFGSDGPDTVKTTQTLKDPAAAFLATDTVADARVVSACAQLTYTGAMVNSAGEIGYLQNFPAQQLLAGGGGSQVMSVDELFVYANVKKRIGVDTHELIYRLNDGSSDHFRSEDDLLVEVPGGTPSTISDSAAALSPYCFGFVWRGSLTQFDATFDFVKAIEWRAEASSGLTQTPVRTHGPSQVGTVNRILDDHHAKHGNLWERTMSSAQNLMQAVAPMTNRFGPAITSAAGNAGRAIMNAGMSKATSYLTPAIEYAAPLMLM